MKITYLLQTTFALSITGQGLTFNYIIAGGGTAGLVIANRLSEDPSITVAVIEPGDDVRDDPGVQNVDTAGLTFSAALNWNYNSTNQPQLSNKVIPYHTGKAIGGTSVINGI